MIVLAAPEFCDDVRKLQSSERANENKLKFAPYARPNFLKGSLDVSNSFASFLMKISVPKKIQPPLKFPSWRKWRIIMG